MRRFATGHALHVASKGAALVEYVVLLVFLTVSFGAVLAYRDEIPRLYEGIDFFEFGETTTVVIEGCVADGTCAAPDEVVDYCLDNAAEGEICDIAPIVWVRSPSAGSDPSSPSGVMVVPAGPSVIYAAVPWATSSRNEDHTPPVYANLEGGMSTNHGQLIVHPIEHPAALYCSARGLYLPSFADLVALQPHAATIGITGGPFLSSSQFWAAGGYNPPPVLRPINYAKAYNFTTQNLGQHVFPTSTHSVICVDYK